MAVKRVFGTVNGETVELTYTDGRWIVPVPYIEGEKYMVEIFAEDEAGNRSYVTKLLLVVNNAILAVSVHPILYYAALIIPNGWKYEDSSRSIEVQETFYTVSTVPDKFNAIVMPDKKATEERRYICSVLDSIWEKTSMCDLESVP